MLSSAPWKGSGLALGEEQQIGFDAGVRVKHAVGQPYDGVQVALGEQFLFQPGFHTFTKQEAIPQYHRRSQLNSTKTPQKPNNPASRDNNPAFSTE